MLDTNEVAEVLGRTSSSVRVLLHRRGQLDSGGLLKGGRVDLLAGIIPEPALRLGVSPGWHEFDIYRFRAYVEAGRMAERAEARLLLGNAAESEALLAVLRYPGGRVFFDWLTEAFDSEVSA